VTERGGDGPTSAGAALAADPDEKREGKLVRTRWILALLLTLLSTGIVVGAFNPAPHTGGDNAGYLALAYSLLTTGNYTEVFDPAGLPHTKYPPVFPLLLAGLMAGGVRSWAGFKALAAVATVLTSLASYLWAERRIGPVWAFGVSVLVSLSSAVVYYSHWILSDPLFVAFTLASLWALEGSDAGASRWTVVGIVAAGLAYFTRSAGLPLLVAVGGWLLLRRRWKASGVAAVVLGVPLTLWLVRSRAAAGDYMSEFWLVNPYDPAAGTVGVGGLMERLLANGEGYVGAHLPSGIVGGGGFAVTVLGVAVVALALTGWVRAARKSLGMTELFLPLYAGLILLWPEVWSGDRFALPLYPVLFMYAASTLRGLTRRMGPRVVSLAGACAFLVLALPALGSWVRVVQEAQACGARIRTAGSFSCYGPRVEAFVDAAGWAADNLPDGSAVLSRKPRLFFVLSGVPSRTFPFSGEPEVQLAGAKAVGASYVLLDEWDALAGRYVGAAVQARPEAFCVVRTFGAAGRTLLLGITPDRQGGVGDREGAGVLLNPCPASYGDRDGTSRYSSASTTIPMLAGLDP
jgi:hypothetical protein